MSRAGSRKGSPRRRGSPRKEHARKQSAFSWEIEGSDYTRKVNFKALKDEEKIGFGLGGKDQRTEVVCIRTNTQAYWKGIKVGYKVLKVNGKDVNKITVTPAIREACVSSKDFSITLQIPNKPDWADKNEPGDDDAEPMAPSGADDEEDPKKVPEAQIEYAFMKDKNTVDEKKESGANASEDAVLERTRSQSRTLAAATVTQAAPNAEDNQAKTTGDSESLMSKPLKDEDISKASKAELEELEKQKKAEIAALEKAQGDLASLIKQKEAELSANHERAVLEELKRLRKKARELRDALRRALEELERIRAMLRKRLEELEKQMGNLSENNAARDAKLSELEAMVSDLQKSAAGP